MSFFYKAFLATCSPSPHLPSSPQVQLCSIPALWLPHLPWVVWVQGGWEPDPSWWPVNNIHDSCPKPDAGPALKNESDMEPTLVDCPFWWEKYSGIPATMTVPPTWVDKWRSAELEVTIGVLLLYGSVGEKASLLSLDPQYLACSLPCGCHLINMCQLNK